jgi:hypothetical protein
MNMSKELKEGWLPRFQVRYWRRNREGKSRILYELCDDCQFEGGGWLEAYGRAHSGSG